MKEVFAKRRQVYYAENAKYLRYVFNDHFMLFLVIVIGALAVQYAQFLQHNQLTGALRLFIGLLISLVALLPGKLVSLLEPADATFLLAKEAELQQALKNSEKNSLIFPALIEVLLVLIATPALKIPLWLSLVWLIVLVALKKGLFHLKVRSFEVAGNLDFERAIAYEQTRRTSLLKIFALFTNVKGLTNQAKRRKYLDILLPRQARSAYDFLLWRTLFRTSDYVGMFVRLLLIVLGLMVFVGNTLFVVLFATLINYLLIFQFLALEKSQDYQSLLKIYPIDPISLPKAVKGILLKIMCLFFLMEDIFVALFGLINGQLDLLVLLAFYVLSPVIFVFYLNYRLKIKK